MFIFPDKFVLWHLYKLSKTDNPHLALEAPEEEDGEHGAVEDVPDLALVVVVHQVVVVPVVPADVRLPLLLRLPARLVVRREQVLVVLEPLQRLLGHRPRKKKYIFL